MKPAIHFLCSFAVTASLAQSPQTLMIRDYRTKNEHAIITEFVRLLSMPNVATNVDDIVDNAEMIMAMMQKRGIQNVQMLQAKENTPPAVYGEIIVPNARRTLVFYAHYDGQPVNAANWSAGLSPFKPQLLSDRLDLNPTKVDMPGPGKPFNPEWRIYARGSSDDKGGVMAILTAVDAVKATGQSFGSNIKFFFEGEEEAGSPHLGGILGKYKDLLKADLWIFCDGPVHQSGNKQVVFGVRGDTHVELTLYGPKRPLHSGHYGNWATNPAMELAKLLASMKDENGRVTIKDFYADVTPLSEVEKKALSAIPAVDEQMLKELGLPAPESRGMTLAEAISLPSLNVNGLQSANVGRLSANVIPVTATASLDLRLVPGNDWQRQQQKVIDHVASMGYTVLDHEPTEAERNSGKKLVWARRSDGYNAQRTPMDMPIAQEVIAAISTTDAFPVVLVPSSGGSLPLFLFDQILGAKVVSVPLANHDNNQHAENENLKLRNFWSGIETHAALMMMKPPAEVKSRKR
jgi:acetylornithine deacetylase/succinyl-diaminopimelate desuccinylase-like protein